MASELEVYFALTLKCLKTLTPCPQKAAPEGFILPFCREKKLAAAQSIYRQHSRFHEYPVVQSRMLQQLHDRIDGTCLGIVGAIDESPNT
jgi:hypothetical protein